MTRQEYFEGSTIDELRSFLCSLEKSINTCLKEATSDITPLTKLLDTYHKLQKVIPDNSAVSIGVQLSIAILTKELLAQEIFEREMTED